MLLILKLLIRVALSVLWGSAFALLMLFVTGMGLSMVGMGRMVDSRHLHGIENCLWLLSIAVAFWGLGFMPYMKLRAHGSPRAATC